MFHSTKQAARALGSAWYWPNFSLSELSCRCAGRFCAGAYWHSPSFLDGLQSLRDRIGAPLRLSSAHRCPQWNAWVGGAPLSQHKSMAVDILITAHDRHELLHHARAIGFTGFGLAKSFLHLDQRIEPAMWYYKGSRELWQTS
ncbi:MAG: D-Ala-D-Ala carboxypeptidase family metallohydrolase [Pseudomonadota bacterium]